MECGELFNAEVEIVAEKSRTGAYYREIAQCGCISCQMAENRSAMAKIADKALTE
jgi:hypothetical protein